MFSRCPVFQFVHLFHWLLTRFILFWKKCFWATVFPTEFQIQSRRLNIEILQTQEFYSRTQIGVWKGKEWCQRKSTKNRVLHWLMEFICPFETKVVCSTLSCQSHLLVKSIIYQKTRKQGKKQSIALGLLLGSWDQSLLAAWFLGQKSKRQQMTGNKTAPDSSNHMTAAGEWKSKFYFSIIM